jgi:hypothetical protein
MQQDQHDELGQADLLRSHLRSPLLGDVRQETEVNQQVRPDVKERGRNNAARAPRQVAGDESEREDIDSYKYAAIAERLGDHAPVWL